MKLTDEVMLDSNIYFQHCTVYSVKNLTRLGGITLSLYFKDGKILTRKNDAPIPPSSEDGDRAVYVAGLQRYPGDKDVYILNFYEDGPSDDGQSAFTELKLVEGFDRDKLDTLIDQL